MRNIWSGCQRSTWRKLNGESKGEQRGQSSAMRAEEEVFLQAGVTNVTHEGEIVKYRQKNSIGFGSESIAIGTENRHTGHSPPTTPSRPHDWVFLGQIGKSSEVPGAAGNPMKQE